MIIFCDLVQILVRNFRVLFGLNAKWLIALHSTAPVLCTQNHKYNKNMVDRIKTTKNQIIFNQKIFKIIFLPGQFELALRTSSVMPN